MGGQMRLQPILAMGLGISLAASPGPEAGGPGFKWLGLRAGTVFFDPTENAGSPILLGLQGTLVFEGGRHGISLDGCQYQTKSSILPGAKPRYQAFSASFLTGLSEDPAAALWPYLGLGLGTLRSSETDPLTFTQTTTRATTVHASLGFVQRSGAALFWGMEGRAIFRLPARSLQEIQASLLLGYTWGARPAVPPAPPAAPAQVPAAGRPAATSAVPESEPLPAALSQASPQEPTRPAATAASTDGSAPVPESTPSGPVPLALVLAPTTVPVPAPQPPAPGPASSREPARPTAAAAPTAGPAPAEEAAAPSRGPSTPTSPSPASMPPVRGTTPVPTSGSPSAALVDPPPPSAEAVPLKAAPTGSNPEDRLAALRRGDIPRAQDLSRAYLETLPADHWTLRLEAARRDITLKNAAWAYPGRPDLFLAPLQVRDGRSIHQLFLGVYASKAEAEQALRAVPAYFLKDRLRPFPLKVSDIPARACPMTRPAPKPRPASIPAPKGIPVRGASCTRCH